MKQYKNTCISIGSYVAVLILIISLLGAAPFLAFSFDKIIPYSVLFSLIFIVCLVFTAIGIFFARLGIKKKEFVLINTILMVIGCTALILILLWYGYASSFV